jgi:DNA-binding CsgD family transcriptional regulator
MHSATGAAARARVVVVADCLLPPDGVDRLIEAGIDVVGLPSDRPLHPAALEQERQDLRALSVRELAVLAMMAEGCSNRAVCERLGLCPKTVECHVHGIFAKLGLQPSQEVHRRVLAVLVYLRHRSRAG